MVLGMLCDLTSIFCFYSSSSMCKSPSLLLDEDMDFSNLEKLGMLICTGVAHLSCVTAVRICLLNLPDTSGIL